MPDIPAPSHLWLSVSLFSFSFADGAEEDPRAYAANAYLGMLAQWQTKQQQQAAALAAVASGDFLSGGSVGVTAGAGGDKAAAALPDMLVQVRVNACVFACVSR